MCDITLALMAAGTALAAGGQITQAKSAKAAGDYNAKVGEMNAVLAERRARDALERGKIDEQRKRAEVGAIRGQQIAALSANGVDASFGSPLSTIIDTATLGEIDALTIRANSYREEREHLLDAANKRAGSALSKMEGKSALKAGYLSAAGTVLTGASKGYSHYKTSGGGSSSLLG